VSLSTTEVVRYRKDQRPTTLPIQPFMFQHLGKTQAIPLCPLLNEYVSHLCNRSNEKPVPVEVKEDVEAVCHSKRSPDTVRPSPLGSYSPGCQQGAPSSSSCSTCSPSPEGGPSARLCAPVWPPCSLSCSLSTNKWPQRLSPRPPQQPRTKQVLPATPPPVNAETHPPTFPAVLAQTPHRASLSTLPDSTLSHLSHLKASQRYRIAEEAKANGSPYAGPCATNGQSVKQLQHYYSDFFPEYFSLTEKPPEEFCLSPDTTSESISVNLLEKKGLVKAINTAVDLIVTHFGTNRNPGVKAKLGNSSVSPNVGHIILKYLCPAIRDILQDGLRAYLLDLIIGQRRNQPWSVVEASTQLGPSTRVLHSLFSKVSQYSELTSPNMRLNAFIIGLLNLQSLEFWFNHLYAQEDVIAAHYHPWGFLVASQGACHALFEELLLLLQPLSLLPFDLDLLFELRLLQKGQEHLRRKAQLCSTRHGLEHSVRSTFQLMRGLDTSGTALKSEEADNDIGKVKLKKKSVLREKGMQPTKEGTVTKEGGMMQIRNRVGLVREAAAAGGQNEAEEKDQVREEDQRLTKRGADFWGDSGGRIVRGMQRLTGVGSESLFEQDKEKQDSRNDKEHQPIVDGPRQRDRQAGWWFQLMQSSQVYIDKSTEGSKFVKWERRKKSVLERQADGPVHWNSQPPPREGVVEGAEAFQEQELVKEGSGDGCSSSSTCSDSSSKGKGKSSWMGSPPESVLNELKRSKEKEPEEQRGIAEALEETSRGIYWSRLFGATGGCSVRTERTEQRLTKSHKNREVPSLGHRVAAEPRGLSFNCEDLLHVLGCSEADWLDYSLGRHTSLVSTVYASLTEEPEGQL
ncbi:hypothetical protein Z043_122590, partial [Scleropages formosus]